MGWVLYAEKGREMRLYLVLFLSCLCIGVAVAQEIPGHIGVWEGNGVLSDTGNATAPGNFTVLGTIQTVNTPCNGASNDTAAINAALAQGGRVILPRGTCSVSSPLQFSPNTILQGQGPGITTIKPTAAMAAVINFHLGNGQGSLLDLTIDDRASGYASALITLKGYNNVQLQPTRLIHNVTLHCNTARDNGILAEGQGQGDNAFNFVINTISTEDCKYAVHVRGTGVAPGPVNDVITNSSITNGGIMIDAVAGQHPPEGWIITNNSIFPLNGGASGIEIRGGIGFRIANNIIDQIKGSNNCIVLDSDVVPTARITEDVTVTDNFCGGVESGRDGIRVVNATYVRMSGNSFVQFTGWAIVVTSGWRFSSVSDVATHNIGGDMYINGINNATLVAPQFSSSIGINLSTGSYCRLGGEILGTINWPSSCS